MDSPYRWVVVGGVVSCLITAALPARAGAELASIAGRVLNARSWSAVEGATVVVVDHGSGAVHRSGVTGDEGSFRLDDLSPGSYSLAVETEQGAYLSETAIPLHGGETRLVKVAINRQEEPDPAAPPTGKSKGGPWSRPLTATLMVIGGAVVLGVLVDQATEGPASPS